MVSISKDETRIRAKYTRIKEMEDALENLLNGTIHESEIQTLLELYQKNRDGAMKKEMTYFVALWSFYSKRASSFASLFLAILFGLYTLTAMTIPLYAILRAPWLLSPIIFTFGQFYAIVIFILSCAGGLTAYYYIGYSNLATEANNFLVERAPSKQDFVDALMERIASGERIWTAFHSKHATYIKFALVIISYALSIILASSILHYSIFTYIPPFT